MGGLTFTTDQLYRGNYSVEDTGSDNLLLETLDEALRLLSEPGGYAVTFDDGNEAPGQVTTCPCQ